MFLQLVAGGHLLLFVTRSEAGSSGRPGRPCLVGAILATQALAVLMCGFGWLIPAIPWTTIAWVWGYNLVWLLVLGAVRVGAERLLDDRTARRQRSLAIVGAPISRRRLLRGEVMDYRKRFAVEPGSRVKLKAIDPAFHGKHADEASAEADLAREVSRLTALQYRLYAEKKHACLIVLQGIDAAGKDGTVWHVMTALNPQGTTVTGFKQPTELEHDHDFLWRVHPHAPRSAGRHLQPLLRGRAGGARARPRPEGGLVQTI